MQKIIDALAEKLADAFVKAVEPKLEQMIDRQTKNVESKLGSFINGEGTLQKLLGSFRPTR